jgi:hypothetical protein
MKTVTLPEEFVLEAHKAACSEWKVKIENQIPELFTPKYKKGDKFVRNEGMYGGRTYLLSNIGDGKCCLIDMEDGDLWCNVVKVHNPKNITEAEFNLITGITGFSGFDKIK